jgi:hypothetical protein
VLIVAWRAAVARTRRGSLALLASPKGKTNVAMAFGRKMPSRLILPVVPGVDVSTGLPSCPGLRGEPCRAYQPLANRGAKP